MCMPSYSRHTVVLVRYPFSDLSNSKVRPAVVVGASHLVGASHPSQDLLITPLTSKTGSLLPGEFVLTQWAAAGLNVTTAVKRGLYTVHGSLVIKALGKLGNADVSQLEESLRGWLGL